MGRTRVLLGALALTAATAAGSALERVPPMPVLAQSTTDQTLLRRVAYNYAPAIIRDGATYHLYWCAGDGGDTIFHLQAAALAGPWRSTSVWSRHDVALRPTGGKSDFDGLHTCDPNVIAIGGRFYLYYTGQAKDGALGEIGVAASGDAVHFERLNAGKPIVVPSKTRVDFEADGKTYGVGQPAVAYVAAWVYLSFTDSTGAGGDGQYVLRSRDPAFAKGVEELTATGWQSRTTASRTGERSWLESYGLDLMYDRPSGALIAATDRVPGKATIIAVDPATMLPLAEGNLALAWREGPSLVAEADKTSAPRTSCEHMPVTVAAAAGTSADPSSWTSLAYSQGEMSLAFVCNRRARR